jgi:hypothetical protein
VQTDFQRCFSISVWCGMIDAMLIGPIILDNCMTEYNYLHFLQKGLPEQLENVWLHGLLCTFSMNEKMKLGIFIFVSSQSYIHSKFLL